MLSFGHFVLLQDGVTKVDETLPGLLIQAMDDNVVLDAVVANL